MGFFCLRRDTVGRILFPYVNSVCKFIVAISDFNGNLYSAEKTIEIRFVGK